MLGECHISFFILSALHFYLTLSILGCYSDLGVSANLHISFYPPYNFTKTIETAPAGKVKVFFDNTIENLKNVYCYIYNGTEASVEWPGVKMQLDEETEYNGKKGYYSLEVPADFLTGCFVINNGEAGSTLQGETVYVNGKVVTAIENTTITAVKKTTDDAWYSITGVRISKPAQPGLYIHNGKKVIIRK